MLLAGALAGCVGDDSGATVGALGAAPLPGNEPVAAAPAPVSMGPFLDGPIGAKLAQADRDSAFKAETQALSTGQRETWRGSRGVYGYVVPGAPGSGGAASAGGDGTGECRSFTHTIYFAGRPQKGSGSGCRSADGTWRIAG